MEAYTAWGGVPRYWELSVDTQGPLFQKIDRLVLNPLGPLHREPDRLIAEEMPPATEVRALLDVIGGGAHRLSEIGGRLGRPSTSLGRPLQRLQGMGLVKREIPFGEDEASTKKSLYRISDPFTRLWFRVVAPHRAFLAMSTQEGRLSLLQKYWPQLMGEAWEELCRLQLPRLSSALKLGGLWGPASRWWRGNDPEWDLVARSLDGRRLLLGEAKLQVPSLERAGRALAERRPPALPGIEKMEIVRVLSLCDAAGERTDSIQVVTAEELLGYTTREAS